MSSPLVRAQQTSKVLLDAFSLSSLSPENQPIIKTLECLHCDAFDDTAVINYLNNDLEKAEKARKAKDRTYFLVGHVPTLPYFATTLANQPFLPLNSMEKSSAAILKFENKIILKKGEPIGYFPPQEK